ncbi:hypothetical protein [Piscinibacter sp. XHJ-5]|uniref:hypothetical protein n=1 Tax=Piscinibacter sp. XHJ-5 TaxID=3037797 RepID=UPI0024530AF1|nr:hypothetical protein [Piscinibacter sp. XHJ-5]
MLRGLAALLLLANLAFFAWTQGWLDNVVGVRAAGDREPERLQRQVNPEVVRILTPQAVAAAASAAELRLACLEAGPFDAGTIGAAETALSATLPSGTWARVTTERPTAWIVYMGRFANREALQRKQQELDRIRISVEEVRNAPDLEPGLSLGRFAQRADAETALADMARRGVQTARVVEMWRSATLHMLRVQRADPELAARVMGLRLDALGKGFGPCARSS